MSVIIRYIINDNNLGIEFDEDKSNEIVKESDEFKRKPHQAVQHLEYIALGSLFKDSSDHNMILGGTIDKLPKEYNTYVMNEIKSLEQYSIPRIEMPDFTNISQTIDSKFIKEEVDWKLVQNLFELLKGVSKFVYKKEQKKIIEQIINSPEIVKLELKNKFGLVNVSHIKISEKIIQQKKQTKQII